MSHHRPHLQVTVRVGAAIAALVAIAATSLVPGMAAQAAAQYPVNTWDYPADLHQLTTASVGQTFEIPDDGTGYDLVGGRFANYDGLGSGVVLDLREDGPSGDLVATREISTLQDNTWVTVQADVALEPGTYYLEARQPVGAVAWWSDSADVYAGGTAYLNGATVSGDRTLVIDSTTVVLPPLVFEGRVATVVAAWDYPADLHASTTVSLGQTVTIPVGSPPIDTVGGRFANYSGEGDGLTMTLREDGPSGDIVATQVVSDLGDNVWLGVTAPAPLDAGTYYLEVSSPVGPVAWWSSSVDGYAGGAAFTNGSAVAGDRTLFLRRAAQPPVTQAGFVDGIADGVTFDSEGMLIERTDTSGFAYDYAPTVIVENGVERVWWCGHNFGGDGIYYSEREAPGSWSEPVLVLTADRPWETTHACDPSVVMGEFVVDSVEYDYLMFYGAADLSGQNTKLGLAFSNDGTTWVKPIDEALLEEPGLYYDYGVGMPALFTIDDQVFVAYYDTGRNSATIIREVEADGSLGASLSTVPHGGGDTFADLAFSPTENRWYLATKSQQQSNSDAESYVYRSTGADLTTSEWVYLGVVGEHLTGFALNHNAGWYRTPDGSLYEPGGVKTLVFGAQDDLDSISNPDAWDLAAVTITGSPAPAPGVPGSFSLVAPAASASLDPLDVDGFSWTASSDATSYTVRVGTSPSLSNATVVLSTTVHPTTTETLPTVYDTGSSTQRMALAPGETYYWDVVAVNPSGATSSSGPRQFTTTTSYRLDLTDGGYTDWREVGNGGFVAGSPAVFEFPDVGSAVRTGRDYNPTRIRLDDLDTIRIDFADGSDPAALGELTVSYRLQQEVRSTPVHTVTVDIGDELSGSTLAIDMTGQPGWSAAGSAIAELAFSTSAPGSLTIDGIEIVRAGVAPDQETGPPAPASLSTTSGWATGLHDGEFELRLDLWWGANASQVRILENDRPIFLGSLEARGPAAQHVVVPISGRLNGTYRYLAELTNSHGTTVTSPVVVTVSAATPTRPSLSHDNWDADGDYRLSANLWWGTNATSWQLREDGVVVASGELVALTPARQEVVVEIGDRGPGRREYVMEFRNAAGVTMSEPVRVVVGPAS